LADSGIKDNIRYDIFPLFDELSDDSERFASILFRVENLNDCYFTNLQNLDNESLND
jgi:hypothetical protein